ncbi:MAG: endonuclease/exonuclease/phosphatase family protein [Adhaeribacter sp.]
MSVKNLFLLLSFPLLFSCGEKSKEEQQVAPAPQGPVVKVMTFNIFGARPGAGLPPAEVNELAKVINDQKPDLVALQEVDVYTNRSGKSVHHAADIARLTGMYWFFTKAIDRDGGEYGDAVLSRFPILESKRFTLPVADGLGGEFRSVALVKVQKDNKPFYFASTHLDHLQQEDNRLLQAQHLKQIVQEEIKGPLILAGDLNAVPESQTMNIIRGFMNLGCRQQCPFTYPASNPSRTIDYILSAPAEKFSVLNYQAIPYLNASDHAPVIATIQVK